MDAKTAEAKYTATHIKEFVEGVKKMETEKGTYKVGKHEGSYDDLVGEYRARPNSFTRDDCLGLLQLARYNGDRAMSGVFSAAAFDLDPIAAMG